MARRILRILEEIARLLTELFLPLRQEGDPEPDFFGTVVALGRGLKDAIDRVVSADARLLAANSALDAERAGRERKASGLSRLVIGLRGACNSLFIDLPVHQLGFDSRTFQDPVPLLIQADRVVENLENGEIDAEHLFPDDDFDPKKYAVQVRERADDLRECLDHLADLRRQADEALLDKRALTEAYDELFLHGARTFESYCRMAGKTELADRVRPSIGRRGRTEVPPDDVPADDVPPDDVPPDDVPPDDVPVADATAEDIAEDLASAEIPAAAA